MNAHEDEGLLTRTAKAIGNVAGKVVAGIGGAEVKPQRATKLVKKHKSRLPRKQKKAMKKAAQQV
jgi:hypothetical protein